MSKKSKTGLEIHKIPSGFLGFTNRLIPRKKLVLASHKSLIQLGRAEPFPLWTKLQICSHTVPPIYWQVPQSYKGG